MIGAILISLLAIASFAWFLWRADILSIAHRSMRFSIAGIGAMLDPSLGDDAKERAVRREGLRLIATAGKLALVFSGSLFCAALPIMLADRLGIVARADVFSLMLRIDYVIIVSIVISIAFFIWRKIRRKKISKTATIALASDNYSEADRIFHYIAFANPAVLRAVSRTEDRLIKGIPVAPAHPPVFITSLARGGTTAVLNALHAVPGVATHIYRDMPFITAPILWHRLSGGEKRQVERRERAHGDGIEMDLDVPEAFEEVIWKMNWPRNYAGAAILLWDAESKDAEAEAFLRRHMAKIVHMRGRTRDKSASSAVYCSKNNANIARLALLKRAFPGCKIVVPVRRPEAHAQSLLRQHRNFLKIHREDEFVERYMRDIGHFEFGAIHKPFAFPGFEQHRYDPESSDYWLAYWIASFRAVLDESDGVHFLSQEDLRERPQQTMDSLCQAIGLDPWGVDFTRYFRTDKDTAAVDNFSPELMIEARQIHREMERRATEAVAPP